MSSCVIVIATPNRHSHRHHHRRRPSSSHRHRGHFGPSLVAVFCMFSVLHLLVARLFATRTMANLPAEEAICYNEVLHLIAPAVVQFLTTHTVPWTMDQHEGFCSRRIGPHCPCCRANPQIWGTAWTVGWLCEKCCTAWTLSMVSSSMLGVVKNNGAGQPRSREAPGTGYEPQRGKGQSSASSGQPRQSLINWREHEETWVWDGNNLMWTLLVGHYWQGASYGYQPQNQPVPYSTFRASPRSFLETHMRDRIGRLWVSMAHRIMRKIFPDFETKYTWIATAAYSLDGAHLGTEVYELPGSDDAPFPAPPPRRPLAPRAPPTKALPPGYQIPAPPPRGAPAPPPRGAPIPPRKAPPLKAPPLKAPPPGINQILTDLND